MESISLRNNGGQFLRVRDVDWSEFEMNRAGITPIYYDGKYSWIGLGIGRFSAGLACIGGSYDKSLDFDLLSTAVREYNEEIGSVLGIIEESYVINCYCIVSDKTIQILYPVANKNGPFAGNEELYDFIWVTPDQLAAFLRKEHVNLYSKTLAFSLTRTLKSVSKSTIESVKSGVPFNIPLDKTPLQRKEKVSVKSTYIEKNTIREFRTDILGRGRWYWVTLALDDENCCIMRDNLVTYFLPKRDLLTALRLLASKNIKIFVTNNKVKDLLNSEYSTSFSNGVSVESTYQSYYDKYNKDNEMLVAKTRFVRDIQAIQTNYSGKEILIRECFRMVEAEYELYDFVEQTNLYFSESRACFLKGIGIINNLLSQVGGSLEEFRVRFHSTVDLTCFSKDTKSTIDMLVNNNVYNRSPQGLISLPDTPQS